MMIIPISSENMSDCVLAYVVAYNGPPWNYHWTHEKVRAYLSEYVSSAQFVGFALYEEERVVAAAFAHTKTWWTGKQLMIDEFFVLPEKQGRGYGRQLLTYCETYASFNQITSVVLMTSKYMPSYQFYDRLAYTNAEQYVLMFKQPGGE